MKQFDHNKLLIKNWSFKQVELLFKLFSSETCEWRIFLLVRKPITPHRVPPAESSRTLQSPAELWPLQKQINRNEWRESFSPLCWAAARSISNISSNSFMSATSGWGAEWTWTWTGTNWTQTGSLCESKCGEEECVAAESLLAQTLTPSFIQLSERGVVVDCTISPADGGGRGRHLCKGSFCCTYLLLESNDWDVCQQWMLRFLFFSF